MYTCDCIKNVRTIICKNCVSCHIGENCRTYKIDDILSYKIKKKQETEREYQSFSNILNKQKPIETKIKCNCKINQHIIPKSEKLYYQVESQCFFDEIHKYLVPKYFYTKEVFNDSTGNDFIGIDEDSQEYEASFEEECEDNYDNYINHLELEKAAALQNSEGIQPDGVKVLKDDDSTKVNNEKDKAGILTLKYLNIFTTSGCIPSEF